MNDRQRNYEIDFLRIIFTICIFMTHTAVFIEEGSKFSLPKGLDWVSVFFFFLLSGMFMVESYRKTEVEKNVNAGGRL